MKAIFRKSDFLIQNRLRNGMAEEGKRMAFYRRVLHSFLRSAKRGDAWLRVPAARGLRSRLPGKPFHPTPEYFFQVCGRTCFALPAQEIGIRPGEAAVIPAQMPHGERWLGKDFLNLIVMFQPESFSIHIGYLEREGEALRCGPIDRFPSMGRFAALRYAEELVDFSPDGEEGRVFRRGLGLALVARLLRGVDERETEGGTSRRGVVARCQERIEVHFAEMDLTVASLARDLGCSADHLSRRFRAETGTRLIEAIHGKRIERARRLLAGSELNIAETAWACGFGEPSYFSRIFRRVAGVSPREFLRGGKRGGVR